MGLKTSKHPLVTVCIGTAVNTQIEKEPDYRLKDEEDKVFPAVCKPLVYNT